MDWVRCEPMTFGSRLTAETTKVLMLIRKVTSPTTSACEKCRATFAIGRGKSSLHLPCHLPGSTETLLILLKGKSDTCCEELPEISLKMLRLGRGWHEGPGSSIYHLSETGELPNGSNTQLLPP